MSTNATTQLREPDQIDWEKHNSQSTYVPPPPAKDASGNYIIYQAKLPANMREKTRYGVTDEGLRSYELGPLTLTLPNGKATEIRFYTVNVRQFKNRKTGEPINMSSASKVLKAAGVAQKPNSNKDYDLAFASIGGRNIPITIEWKARNKDTGEVIDGYDNFPDDPERPGQKLAVVKAGTTLPDGTVTQAEVLFANAKVRFVEG